MAPPSPTVKAAPAAKTAATDALNEALQEANAQLRRMATTDLLTGLWNRRHLEEMLAQETARADRHGHPLSMLLFDIDHFKRINDQHGHLAGDRVLVALSQLTRQHLRSSDLVCRWGGEEFLVLMPDTDAQEALAVAEKLRDLFASHPIPEVGRVTASFGVARYGANEPTDRWVGRADAALYAAKAGGRNAVRLAAPSADASNPTELTEPPTPGTPLTG